MNNSIVWNSECCDGCGVCISVCPQMVYQQKEERAFPTIAHPDRCYGCMACEEDCPKSALTIYRLPDEMTVGDVPPSGEGLDTSTVYDVLIIGAGPAGLGAAIRARALGMSVAVLERLPSHRRSHHPDGGLLFSPKGVYTMRTTGDGLRLEELDVTIPGRVVLEWLTDFRFYGPEGQRTKKHGDSWSGFPLVDKDAFIAHIAEQALSMGAVIAYNTRARTISPPDTNGTRTVLTDKEKSISARVILSAEGITGRLADSAGILVNEKKIGWSVSAYGSFPALPKPTMEAAFFQGWDECGTDGEKAASLRYYSSGPVYTHVASGPIQRTRKRTMSVPATEMLLDFIKTDPVLREAAGAHIDWGRGTFDGCRVYVREVPSRFVADGMMAVGDAITTCGMMTNILAMKTGDLAAQTAFNAIRKRDTSASALLEYERAVRKISMFGGMSWMNNILIKAPMELSPERLNVLCDLLKHLSLTRMQKGEIIPLVLFYGRIFPVLMRDKALRTYLVP